MRRPVPSTARPAPGALRRVLWSALIDMFPHLLCPSAGVAGTCMEQLLCTRSRARDRMFSNMVAPGQPQAPAAPEGDGWQFPVRTETRAALSCGELPCSGGVTSQNVDSSAVFSQSAREDALSEQQLLW